MGLLFLVDFECNHNSKFGKHDVSHNSLLVLTSLDWFWWWYQQLIHEFYQVFQVMSLIDLDLQFHNMSTLEWQYSCRSFLQVLHSDLGIVLTTIAIWNWAFDSLNWSYHSMPVLSQSELMLTPLIYMLSGTTFLT